MARMYQCLLNPSSHWPPRPPFIACVGTWIDGWAVIAGAGWRVVARLRSGTAPPKTRFSLITQNANRISGTSSSRFASADPSCGESKITSLWTVPAP